MKHLFLVAVLCMSSSAFAWQDNKSASYSPSSDKAYLAGSMYESLQRDMSYADLGNYSQEDNTLWSGRCYQRSAPYTAIAGAVLFRLIDDGRGPRGSRALYAGSIWNQQASSDYFDYRGPYSVGNVDYVPAIRNLNLRGHSLNLNNGTSTLLRQSGSTIYEAVGNPYEPSAICYYNNRNY